MRCGYCGADCTLPDPSKGPRVRPTARWFVACEARASQATLASWSRIAGAAADARGLVYLAGRAEPGDTETSVFCVDGSMNLRWVKRALPLCSPRAARVALRGDLVVVGEPGQTVVHALRASDGDIAFTFPPASRVSALPIDLRASLGLAFDADGSVLVSVKGAPWGGQVSFALLYRLTAEGELAPTWPGAGPTVPPEIGTTIPSLDGATSFPRCVRDHPGVLFGADEHVYLCFSETLVKLDRGGRWCLSFPSPRGDSWEEGRLGVDARGTVHDVGSAASNRRVRPARVAHRAPRSRGAHRRRSDPRRHARRGLGARGQRLPHARVRPRWARPLRQPCEPPGRWIVRDRTHRTRPRRLTVRRGDARPRHATSPPQKRMPTPALAA